jgi:hypothetical protein
MKAALLDAPAASGRRGIYLRMADIFRKQGAAAIEFNGAIDKLKKKDSEHERGEILSLLRSQAKEGAALNSDEARACYLRLQLRLRARGAWDRDAEFFIALVASQCARYLGTSRMIRMILALPSSLDPGARQYIERCIGELFRLQGEILSAFGIDARTEQEVTALCAPFAKE